MSIRRGGGGVGGRGLIFSGQLEVGKYCMFRVLMVTFRVIFIIFRALF
jgi:hypothetical protein